MAKQPEIVPWSEDLDVTWTVEPCVDGRYAFLTLRTAKGLLVTIPHSTPPWNDAHVHMNRVNAEMLAAYLNRLEGR